MRKSNNERNNKREQSSLSRSSIENKEKLSKTKETDEYLQEESRDIVSGAEIDMFNQQVDILRNDVDRLEARVDRLTDVNSQS